MTEHKNQREQEVHGPQTNIGRDVHGPVLSGVFNAPVVLKNFVNEKIFKRLGVEQRVGFVILAMLIIGVGLGLYLTLRDPKPKRMTGEFKIAVAGFALEGSTENETLGLQLAESVYLRLQETFEETELDFIVSVWGPQRVGSIKASNREKRAQQAEKLAETIGADIIIYGRIDTNHSPWEASPEFYVNARNFYEAQEITGQHDMGMPMALLDRGGIVDRIEVGDKFNARAQVLSQITVGLAYYSVHNYESALRYFESAESIEGWSEEEGKHVLYLLAGNAAGKNENFDLAQTYYKKSLSVVPEYARGYIGLAGVYYMYALEPFQATEEPSNINLSWLEKSINTYQLAFEAQLQPALSDIETKVHFGLGQCYLMQVYSGKTELNSFERALAEFALVIDEYGDGENPRVRELAAESHARIGLIYVLSGQPESALEEYQIAVSLLDDNVERKSIYLKAIQSLSETRSENRP
jgi:tetratricopeptide (TPR) repeat protein